MNTKAEAVKQKAEWI